MINKLLKKKCKRARYGTWTHDPQIKSDALPTELNNFANKYWKNLTDLIWSIYIMH